MEATTEENYTSVKHIFRYVAGTLRLGCMYARGEGTTQLVGYSDSDLGGDIDDRKSTSRTLFLLGGGVVTWQSQKQKIVALSSCEAEYVAIAAATCQGLWLSRLLEDITGTSPAQFKLLVDNKSAIALSKNPVHHDLSKHIDVKFHFVRDCMEKKQVEIDHVGTQDQLADALTKALGRVRFIEMRQRLGMIGVVQ